MTITNLPFNLSKKAVLAFLYPFIAAVAGAGVSWIVNGGALNWSDIRIAAGGTIAAGIAMLGAYVGKPGLVVSEVGTPSDDLMPADARAHLDTPEDDEA